MEEKVLNFLTLDLSNAIISDSVKSKLTRLHYIKLARKLVQVVPDLILLSNDFSVKSKLTRGQHAQLVSKLIQIVQVTRMPFARALRTGIRENVGLKDVFGCNVEDNVAKAVLNAPIFTVAEVFEFVMQRPLTERNRMVTYLDRDRRTIFFFLRALRSRAQRKNKARTPGARCADMVATIYQTHHAPRTAVLGNTERIQRNRGVNNAEGPRYYDALRVNIKRHRAPVAMGIRLATNAISRCAFASAIYPMIGNGRSRYDKVIVVDGLGDVVAAADFNIAHTIEYHDTNNLSRNTTYGANGNSRNSPSPKKTKSVRILEIKYLCSAKLCNGGGTAALRALEYYARLKKIRGIRLVAVDSAVRFYLKLGFVPAHHVKSLYSGTVHPITQRSEKDRNGKYGIVRKSFGGVMVKLLSPHTSAQKQSPRPRPSNSSNSSSSRKKPRAP